MLGGHGRKGTVDEGNYVVDLVETLFANLTCDNEFLGIFRIYRGGGRRKGRGGGGM